MIIDPVHCTEIDCACPGSRWWTGWIGPREIHIVPIDDLQPHHIEECRCDPQITLRVAGVKRPTPKRSRVGRSQRSAR